MNITEVIEKIQAIPLFKGLVLAEPSDDSQYGTIKVPCRHFKDGRGNEYKLGGFYSLFIAHMYKDDPNQEEFFYLSFYHKGTKRDFRRRTWYENEYNKIFVTGNTVEKLIGNLESSLVNYSLK
jgi:hypothetical protein